MDDKMIEFPVLPEYDRYGLLAIIKPPKFIVEFANKDEDIITKNGVNISEECRNFVKSLGFEQLLEQRKTPGS